MLAALAAALAVKGGTILAVGARAEIEKAHKGKTTRTVDLAGKTPNGVLEKLAAMPHMVKFLDGLLQPRRNGPQLCHGLPGSLR